MKRGPRNMQMSREAMPPIRISPSIRATQAPSGVVLAVRAPARGRPSAIP